MAYIAPQSDIYLTIQTIDRQHKNVIYDNPDNYCMTSPGGGPVLHLTAQQYTQVGAGILRCDVTQLYNAGNPAILNVIENFPFNYIYFRNGANADYRTGAFITNARYVNNGLVEYNYEIDPIVTYFPYSFQSKGQQLLRTSARESYVDQYNLPEPFDGLLGSVIRKRYLGNLFTFLNPWLTLVTANDGGVQDADPQKYPIAKFSNFYSGFRFQQFEPTANGLQALQQVLNRYELHGQESAIVSLCLCPHIDNASGGMGIVTTLPDFPSDIKTTLRWDDYSGQGAVVSYTPKYSKLCRYPYHYIELVDKSTGTSHKYQIERFLGDGAGGNPYKFRGYVTAFPQPSITIAPMHYDALDDCQLDRGFTITLPQIPYTMELFEKWMALNQSLLETQKNVGAVSSVATSFSGVLSILGGIAATSTGVGAAAGIPMIAGGAAAVAGGIGSGVMSHDNYVNQINQAAQMPPQVNTGIAHSAWTFGVGFPEMYEVCVNPEVLRWADVQYMPRFGQSQNSTAATVQGELQNAQIFGEDRVFVQFKGFFPYKVMSSFDIRDQISAIFNNGTTVWESATALAS